MVACLFIVLFSEALGKSLGLMKFAVFDLDGFRGEFGAYFAVFHAPAV